MNMDGMGLPVLAKPTSKETHPKNVIMQHPSFFPNNVLSGSVRKKLTQRQILLKSDPDLRRFLKIITEDFEQIQEAL